MKNFFSKYKIQTIFFSIVIGVLIVMFLLLYPLYSSKGNSEYGNRLDGIKEVKISDDQIKNIKLNIEENLSTEEVNINLSGKILNTVIKLNVDENIDTSLEYLESITTLLDEEQVNYYDIQYFVVQDSINLIGLKNKLSDSISWSGSKEVKNEEEE